MNNTLCQVFFILYIIELVLLSLVPVLTTLKVFNIVLKAFENLEKCFNFKKLLETFKFVRICQLLFFGVFLTFIVTSSLYLSGFCHDCRTSLGFRSPVVLDPRERSMIAATHDKSLL